MEARALVTPPITILNVRRSAVSGMTLSWSGAHGGAQSWWGGLHGFTIVWALGWGGLGMVVGGWVADRGPQTRW
eukprot:SAG11_NODE_12830_length_683_cov_0.916096_1_plen_73_part_10